MAKYITIPGFKGGQALDAYDDIRKQTFQDTRNLDVFVNSNQLAPHKLKLQAMAIPALAGQTDVKPQNSYLASDNKYYFFGDATIAAAHNYVLWYTSTLDSAPTYTTAYATGGTAGATGYVLEEYKDGLFFSWGTNLDRWGNLSGAAARTNIGTVTTGVTHMRNHRGLGVLFFAHNSGHTVGKYNNTTFTATALTFDADDTVVGMEEFGRFLVIGLRGAGSKKSRFVLWDGSATTVEDIYNLNETGLSGFKIVNGVITYISLTYNGQNDFLRVGTLTPGGKPEIVREQQITLTSGANNVTANGTATFGDVMLYGLSGYAYSDLSLGIFGYGSPGSGISKYHALYRLVSSNAVTAVGITSIKHNGTSLVVTWEESGSGPYHIDTITGNGLTLARPSSGVYESNIFPLNGGLKGRIKKITLTHPAIPSSCGFTVYVKHLSTYPFGSTVPSPESYQTLFGPQGNTSTSGMTQSTNNATFTEIASDKFIDATHAQIKIAFDEVSTTTSASIIFPILVEVQ